MILYGVMLLGAALGADWASRAQSGRAEGRLRCAAYASVAAAMGCWAVAAGRLWPPAAAVPAAAALTMTVLAVRARRGEEA